MRSFKSFMRDFLMNRVMANAPAWLLRYYYEDIMVPRAKDDYFAIASSLSRYRLREMYNSPSEAERHLSKNPRVFALVGLPGEGKSTLAGVLARAMHGFRVDSNMIRNWLIEAGRDYANVNTLALMLMVMQLEYGESVIMDSDCMNPLKRAFIKALSRPFGVAKVNCLRIATDHDMWKARVKAADDQTLKMYANGVRRAKGLQADDEVPEAEVLACIEAEWLRQREGHIDYAQTIDAIFVPNSGTKEELAKDVARIAELHFK